MAELPSEQLERIKHYMGQFMMFLTTTTGLEWSAEREERLLYFSKVLNEDHIDHLTEEQFKNIIISLWASQIWGNKDYLVNTIISRNGFQKIRTELKALIYGKETLDKRYDRFRKEIKGLAGASITEILAFVSPDDYCIWNRTPINVLPFLGMKNMLPSQIHTSFMKGKHYVKCIEVMNLIKSAMIVEVGGLEPNFILVDHFLYYILIYEMPEKEKVPESKIEEKIEIQKELKEIHTSEEAIATLLELGNILGFQTYTGHPTNKHKSRKLGEIATTQEVPTGFLSQDVLDIIKDIDVLWFKGEVPEYCFEVEHTTNIRGGLLRLYQISQLKGVRFFVIAPSQASTKFEKEVIRRPFKEIRERYIFRPYEDLVTFYNIAIKFCPIKTKFGI